MLCTDIPATSGVYTIRCLLDRRMYVGSAKNMRKRLQNHRSALRKGTHHSVHLQRAWNKYGEDNFECFVLGVYPVDTLLVEEQYWFDVATCALNGSRIAGRPEHTADVREKLRVAALQRWQDPVYRETLTTARTRNGPQRSPMAGKAHSDTTKATLRAVHRAKHSTIRAFGRLWSMKDLAETYNVKYTMLKDRLRAGWPPEKAVLAPKRNGGL